MSERHDPVPPVRSVPSAGESRETISYALPSTQSPPQFGTAGALTRGDAAVIALRLTGAYCLLQGGSFLAQLPALASILSWRFLPPGPEVFIYLSPCALYTGIGLWQILRTERLAARLLRRQDRDLRGPDAFPGTEPAAGLSSPDGESAHGSPGPEARPATAARFAGMSGQELQSIAYSVIGVYLVAESLVPLTAAAFFYCLGSGTVNPAHGAGQKLAEGAVKLLLGVGMFLGSRRLALLWRRLRRQDR